MTGNGNNGGTNGGGEPDPRLLRELSSFADELHVVYSRAECRGELERYYTLFPRGTLDAPRLEPPRNGQLLNSLIGELLPLSRVLSGLGYHDVALHSAELAERHSPGDGSDAKLTRAYLLALLGETEEAQELYLAAHTELGRIPATDLAMLEDVVRSHPDEDDLAELLVHLRAL